MDYKVENSTYSLSYKELKENYLDFCRMQDSEFMNKLPQAAHLACIIGWLKELPNDLTIGDKGIVHELIHLLDGSINPSQLRGVRKIFEEYLKLA
jgi:hypothetical protein